MSVLGHITGHNFHIYLTKGGNYLSIGGASSNYAIDVNGKFQVEWTGNTYLRGSAKLTVESGQILSGPTGTPGKYYSFSQDGGIIGGWKIAEKTIESNKGENPYVKLESDGNISIKNGSYYFKMGKSTHHPRVSGLNVSTAGTGGISFRSGMSDTSDGTQQVALDVGIPAEASGTYLMTEGNHAVTGYFYVQGKTNFRGDIYLKDGTGFVVTGGTVGNNTFSNLLAFSDDALAAHNDGGIASKNELGVLQNKLNGFYDWVEGLLPGDADGDGK